MVSSGKTRSEMDKDALALTATGLIADKLYADWNRQECEQWSAAEEWALPLLGLSAVEMSALSERVGAALKGG